MAPLSSPTSSRCSCQRSRSATSSSWTMCEYIGSPACARRSRRLEQRNAFSGLNPIENLYAKVKSDLRKGAARTVDTLSRLVGRSLKAIASGTQAIAPDRYQVESALAQRVVVAALLLGAMLAPAKAAEREDVRRPSTW